MNELHFPWLELAVLAPLVGSLFVRWQRDATKARLTCLWFNALTLALALAASFDFMSLHVFQAHDRWDIAATGLHHDVLVIDELSAPLLPMAALLHLLTTAATLRTKLRRFSFAATLVSEGLLLATFACKTPWGIIGLLALSTIPIYRELRARHKPTRVFVLHMALSIACMACGFLLIGNNGGANAPALAVALLTIGVFIRSGILPFHCWVTDLFEHATFGSALLFTTPMVGAYAGMRLLLPVASDETLRIIGQLALATAVYAAGMALVQREARRFFCYLFLSHSALVFVGLDSTSTIGLTGGLIEWLSVGVALSGLGLTLRGLEARHGRLSLDGFHGVYQNTPTLAICFLLTGLASVGFPGTFGFIGAEMLTDGAVQSYPYIGVAVVLVALLNGIAVVQVYFRLFTGTRHPATVPLGMGRREKFAVLTLAALILGGGIFPQRGVASRYHAAVELLKHRHDIAQLPPKQEVASTDANQTLRSE